MTPNRLMIMLAILVILVIFGIVNNTKTVNRSMDRSSSFVSPVGLIDYQRKGIYNTTSRLFTNTLSSHDEIFKKSHVERSLNDEMIQNDLSEWKRFWNHSIAFTKTTDMTLGERQRLWKQLEGQTEASTKLFQDLFEAFPIPKDSISLYNYDAANELIATLLQAQRDGRNFTVVASGGSATAGGGNPSVPQELRYYSILTGYLNAILSSSNRNEKPTVKWIGQGHGFRNSLHTAIFFDSFIPSDTDLLIWEFSINDPSIALKKHELILRSARDNLLTWLTRVKRMQNPPKVLLIYQWDPPFHRDNTTKIASRTFDAHANLARKFDFVVGHVHMAKYIDELEIPNCQTYNRCPILSDHCHISKTGHIATAFLLLNLLNPTMTHEFLASTEIDDDDDSYEWSCGVETKAKRILKEVMTTSSKEWRPPAGSWTHELPLYAQGRLIVGPRKGNTHPLGYEDPVRQDRQLATSIYMCDNANQLGSFSVITPLEPLTNVRVVIMTFKNQDLMQTESFRVRLNGSNETTNGELVPVRVKRRAETFAQWQCHVACPWGDSVDVYVYIFEAMQSTVSSMELCTPTIPVPKPKIQSVAFW